ncbi:MAG: GGDEF domain-containing protein, partial [Nitrosospira sp.]|nr:GGDEF domain-containing protein [Nitrosospira sp.]
MENKLHKGMSQLEDAEKILEHRFLGLKWKVLLLSSMILIAIVAAFTGITYVSLMNDFENQRLMQHERYTSEVEGLIEQTSQSLHQIAELIPLMEGMTESLIAGNPEKLAEIFDPYWALLQINKGIEVVQFYNHANQLLAKWSNAEASFQRNNSIKSWVREVNAKERFSSPLSCDGSCMQFA